MILTRKRARFSKTFLMLGTFLCLLHGYHTLEDRVSETVQVTPHYGPIDIDIPGTGDTVADLGLLQEALVRALQTDHTLNLINWMVTWKNPAFIDPLIASLDRAAHKYPIAKVLNAYKDPRAVAAIKTYSGREEIIRGGCIVHHYRIGDLRGKVADEGPSLKVLLAEVAQDPSQKGSPAFLERVIMGRVVVPALFDLDGWMAMSHEHQRNVLSVFIRPNYKSPNVNYRPLLGRRYLVEAFTNGLGSEDQNLRLDLAAVLHLLGSSAGEPIIQDFLVTRPEQATRNDPKPSWFPTLPEGAQSGVPELEQSTGDAEAYDHDFWRMVLLLKDPKPSWLPIFHGWTQSGVPELAGLGWRAIARLDTPEALNTLTANAEQVWDDATLETLYYEIATYADSPHLQGWRNLLVVLVERNYEQRNNNDSAILAFEVLSGRTFGPLGFRSPGFDADQSRETVAKALVWGKANWGKP